MQKLLLLVCISILFFPLINQAQTCGTTNIAQGKPVVVSSEWQYGLGSSAVDGITNAGWRPDNTGATHYIYVDLLQSYNFCKVKLFWGSDGRGKDYTIQTSTDAISWTTIATRTNNNGTLDSFSVTGTGRYLKLDLTAKINSWSTYQLDEIQIFNYLSNFHPAVSLIAGCMMG